MNSFKFNERTYTMGSECVATFKFTDKTIEMDINDKIFDFAKIECPDDISEKEKECFVKRKMKEIEKDYHKALADGRNFFDFSTYD